MHITLRKAVALLSTAALVGSAASAVSALGDGENTGQKAQLITSLAPSVPSDPMIHGVTAGAAPWVLRHGHAVLDQDGNLTVSIDGLVIPLAQFNFTPGPVTTVDAALYCGSDSNTTPAATTPPVPISRAGDAIIHANVTLPSACLAPIVLINPNGIASIYIATSGFAPGRSLG
jgi:hypothetical protein